MESAYASTFLTSLEPQQAAALYRDRLASNRAIAEDLSEWFKDLQGIEQAYSQGLAKLAARTPSTAQSNMG